MKELLFVEYPKCTTCRNAKKYLESKNIKFIDRDIVLDNPNQEELIRWIKLSGKNINKFFNTSGLKYRKLNLKERIKIMSEEEKIKLLSSDGMLIKRPILVFNNKCLVGFNEEEWNI